MKMTTYWWIKSLQCKSNAVNDVVHSRRHHRQANPKDHHHLNSSTSCKDSVQSLKDVEETTRNSKPAKQKSSKPGEPAFFRRPISRKPEVEPNRQIRTRSSSAESFFPSLTELPEGHPSRNVVEIIFHTSWDEKKNFSGRVEMVFKIQNLTRTVTRFEEYRELVKSRAGKKEATDFAEDFQDHARCVADGNEVMRFYCLGPTTDPDCGGAYEAGGGAWAFSKGATSVCTYSGSGVAHEKAGGGRGRRAMLVCRVIAGRVCKRLKLDSLVEGQVGYESMGGESGELLVFDSRALLPCFLIIYKL